MESSKTTIKYPFSFEWKIKKSELGKLENKERFIHPFRYTASRPLNIKYGLIIYPNGNNVENCGKASIFLYVNRGNAIQVKAEYTISLNSKPSKNFTYIFETYTAYGHTLCNTDDFFNPKNGYFINDELTLAVNGTLEFERTMVTKLPLSLQWTIKENELAAIKTSNANGYLKSKRFNISSDSSIKYLVRIYPNGYKEANRGKAILNLNLELGYGKKVEAFINYSIESAQYSRYCNDIYEKTEDRAVTLSSTDELFDPIKRFFVNGEMIVNLKGFLLIEKKEVPYTRMIIAKGIAPKKMKLQRNMDFSIIVGVHEIKVHKKVLKECSPVFAAMLQPPWKESLENKMEIIDFPYEVCHAAVNLIYSTGVHRTFTLDDMLALLQFFDKYDIQLVKGFVEEYLSKKITASNVCQIFHSSKLYNAQTLHKKAVEFLVQCSKETTPVADIESIDKEELFKILFGTFSHTSETEI